MRSQRQVKTFEEFLKANQYLLMKVHAAFDKVIKKKKQLSIPLKPVFTRRGALNGACWKSEHHLKRW